MQTWADGKQLFSDTAENWLQIPLKIEQKVYGKPCRSGVVLGNLAADVYRQNFLGFRLTPPGWPSENDGGL